MKKTIFAVAALIAMVSCNKTLIEVPMSDFGFIDFGISADTEMVVTKAEEAVPQSGSTYNVTLAGPGANWTKEHKDITAENLTVSKGTYTITAENYTPDEAEAAESGYGDVRVTGTTTVEVTPGGKAPATVKCLPANAKVTVAYGEGFTNVFTSPKITLNDVQDNRSLIMTPATATKDAEDKITHTGSDYSIAYFNVEDGELNWTIEATVNGTPKTYTSSFSVEAAKWNQITFSSGVNGTLTITITVDKDIKVVKDIPVEVDPLTPAN